MARYYVVWVGRLPGIYTSWGACRQQIHGFSGACYKVYDSLVEAQHALQLSPPHAPWVAPPYSERDSVACARLTHDPLTSRDIDAAPPMVDEMFIQGIVTDQFYRLL